MGHKTRPGAKYLEGHQVVENISKKEAFIWAPFMIETVENVRKHLRVKCLKL